MQSNWVDWTPRRLQSKKCRQRAWWRTASHPAVSQHDLSGRGAGGEGGRGSSAWPLEMQLEGPFSLSEERPYWPGEGKERKIGRQKDWRKVSPVVWPRKASELPVDLWGHPSPFEDSPTELWAYPKAHRLSAHLPQLCFHPLPICF